MQAATEGGERKAIKHLHLMDGEVGLTKNAITQLIEMIEMCIRDSNNMYSGRDSGVFHEYNYYNHT